MDQRGIMLVVSSPSGGGKTTLCHRLVLEFDRLEFSISYTTRALRGAEREGVDYHFVGEGQFDAMVQQDRLAEWARVHGNRYGTGRESVELALTSGTDLVFDIDWQGGYQLRDRYPDDTVMVFVLPPSMAELERRLRRRGTDADQVVRRRLQVAGEELEHFGRYDYLVVNDDLGRAYDDLRCIYRAAHLRRRRQQRLAVELIEQLRSGG